MKLSSFLKKGLRFYFKKLGKLNKAPVVTEKIREVPNCNPEISAFIKKKKKGTRRVEIVSSVFAEKDQERY